MPFRGAENATTVADDPTGSVRRLTLLDRPLRDATCIRQTPWQQTGEAFADFHDFKSILVASRTDVFTRHLITQVLSYATGRHMEAVDDYVIDDIFEAVKKDGYGLRTLVTECLASDIFRAR